MRSFEYIQQARILLHSPPGLLYLPRGVGCRGVCWKREGENSSL